MEHYLSFPFQKGVIYMTKQIEILIVEDDKRIADIHRRFIEKIEGFRLSDLHIQEKRQRIGYFVYARLVLLDVYLPDTTWNRFIDIIQEQVQIRILFSSLLQQRLKS